MHIKTDLVIASRIYREGIATCLANGSGVLVSDMHESVAGALIKLDHSCAEVVIVDSHLHDVLPLIYRMKRKTPAPCIIMMMFSYEGALINECVTAGAEGFITNNDSMEDLVNCIVLVHRGHCCYPREFSNYVHNNLHSARNTGVHDSTLDGSLTSRQTRIVQLIENGMSNKAIARELGIQLATVKNHVHQILDRLNVKNRGEAAAVYRRMNQANSLGI